MNPETFHAPDPSDPDRYLKLRGRRWHYVRRVPAHAMHWDRRGTIQSSLKTPSLEVARLKRDELAKADDLYWSGIADGQNAQTAMQIYEAAKKRALGLGLHYRIAEKLSIFKPIERHNVSAILRKLDVSNRSEALVVRSKLVSSGNF